MRSNGLPIPQFAAALCFLLPVLSPAATILAVTDNSTSAVNFFDGSSGTLLHSTPMPLVNGFAGTPAGIAFGADGNFYVADQVNSIIDIFDPTSGAYIGNFIGTGSGASALYSPNAITFGPDGNLYVANAGPGNFGYINAYQGPTGAKPGEFVGQFVPPGYGPAFGGLDYPAGMIFHNGYLYVADSNGGEISRFDALTGTYSQFVPPGNPPSPLSSPEDVFFDAAGNFYVTDAVENAIYEYDSTGAYVGVFSFMDIVQPYGMALGPDGNLYVANAGAITVIDALTGATVNSDFVPVNSVLSPQFLAFSDTPEPSTCTLLGAAALLFAGRRFRSRA